MPGGRLCIHSSKDKSMKRPIFAVVIGINKYDSSSYDNLRAAVEDADRFSNYLTQNLAVSPDNICNLRDENASRNAILDSISWLICHPEIKKNEAAIVIYFAGHGALINKDIQMICPCDIGTELRTCNGQTKMVEGISGGLLAGHFTDLSNAKGSNITIFLDCCHSTGMIKPQTTIRRSATENEGADPSPESPVVFVEDLERYTLITACGRDMQAFESGSRKSGFFTSRLLDVLTAPKAEYLTYISLIHQLGARMYMPDGQMPHCEGSPSRFYRQLYDLDPCQCIVGDASLVMTKRSEDSSITFHAGLANGIVEGLKLSMYANNLADPVRNPCLGQLVAGFVTEFTSSLVCDPMIMDSAITFPSLFYCKIDDSSTRKCTVLYSSDKFWLESVFPPHIQSQLSLNIAGNDKNFDLRLDVFGEKVHFRQGNNCFTTFATDTWVAYKDNINKIHEIVKRYIHFYSHLELTSPHHPGEIDIELNELAYKGGHFVPSKLHILDEDHIRIPASDTKKYGLTLRNRSKVGLYPYLFSFDPMDLTIKALYQPPAAAYEYGLTNKTDSPLLPSSELTIGYGSNVLHGKRFSFCLRPGEQAAIAHLRLYLSSCPTSLESMIRETPAFCDFNERAIVADSEDNSLPPVWWMVKTTTFVIHK